MAANSKHVKHLGELIKDIDTAMLTTVGAGGFLVSRPLSSRQATFDGARIWFFVEGDSPKVAEIRKNAKVNLAYASHGKNTYVSLAGKARISRDAAKADALWNDAMKAFFPKGRNDPNLALLEVEVHTAEYWDGPSSKISRAINFVIARVTKTEEVMAENRIVQLKGGKGGRVSTRLPPSNKAGDVTPAKAVGKAARKAASTLGGKQATKKSSSSGHGAAASRTRKTTSRKAATKTGSSTASRTAKKAAPAKHAAR